MTASCDSPTRFNECQAIDRATPLQKMRSLHFMGQPRHEAPFEATQITVRPIPVRFVAITRRHASYHRLDRPDSPASCRPRTPIPVTVQPTGSNESIARTFPEYLRDQSQKYDCQRDAHLSITLERFCCAIADRGWPSHDRLVVQISPHVRCQCVRRFVAAFTFFVQGTQHNPI